MEINEVQDPDYEVVTISNLGFVDPYGNEGLVILHSDDKREFHMRAFSGEVSRHIASFLDGDHDTVPTIYKMLEDICEANELLLVKVKIYEKWRCITGKSLSYWEKKTLFYEIIVLLTLWLLRYTITFPILVSK
jgi:hypothetical protein